MCRAARSFIPHLRIALGFMDLHLAQSLELWSDPKHQRQIRWGSETDVCQWQSPHAFKPDFGILHTAIESTKRLKKVGQKVSEVALRIHAYSAERKELMSAHWGGAYIGTAHVTSGTDDAEPTTPPTSAQRYCLRFSGSSLTPGDILR